MTVVTFPGQGSQKPGFLSPWLEDAASAATLARLSEASGIDLVAHGTESDADTIRDTAVAQPLIVASSILTWDALVARYADALDGVAVAGHSVGEIPAAYAAGVFTADQAIRFVALRSRLMAQDAAKTTTSMSAVLGGEQSVVLERLEALGLFPANFNGAGQIVAAGLPEQLDALKTEPPAGARVIPLKVAGAFHTSWMAEAKEALGAAITEDDEYGTPNRPLYTNRDGSVVTDGPTYVRYLVEQVNSPVRWDLCMASFVADGHMSLIEAAPAGTLVGLAKRGMKGSTSLAINTPEDIEAAAALLQTA